VLPDETADGPECAESTHRDRWRRLVDAGVRLADVESIVAIVPLAGSVGEETGAADGPDGPS
jgi:hypothetical protein